MSAAVPLFLKAKINAVLQLDVDGSLLCLQLSEAGGTWAGFVAEHRRTFPLRQWRLLVGASLFMNYLRTNISPTWSELLFFQRQCQSGTEEQSIFQCINACFGPDPFIKILALL